MRSGSRRERVERRNGENKKLDLEVDPAHSFTKLHKTITGKNAKSKGTMKRKPVEFCGEVRQSHGCWMMERNQPDLH